MPVQATFLFILETTPVRGHNYPCEDVPFFYAELEMVSDETDSRKLRVAPSEYAPDIPGRLEQFFFENSLEGAGKIS